MKRILKMLCLFVLLAAITLPGVAMAQQIEQSGAAETSVPGLFNAMEKRFNENDYDTAYELAIQIESMGGQNFSSAYLYINYLKGWKAIQVDDIDSALSYLSPIVPAAFMDSEGYYYYLMGRKEQANGNFHEAISYYQQASALQVYNGVGYQSECEIALNAEAYAAAERYEQQQNYLMAAQAFEALNVYKDSNERKKACYYAYAGQLVADMKYAEAAEVYNLLGTYKDCTVLAEKYYQLSQTDFASTAITDVSALPLDPHGAIVTWTDALKIGGSFTVSWYPGNMANEARTQTVSACTAVLDDLYPNTTYRVIIASDTNVAARAEVSVTTPQTANQTDLKLFTHDILAYALQDKSIGLAQLQGIGKAHVLENNVVPLPGMSMSYSGSGCMLSCSIDRTITETDEIYNYLCVLRIGTEYVTATEGSFEIKGFWRFPSFYIDLTTMFDSIYNVNGYWPGNNAVIDLYINDSLFVQSNVMLLNGQ